MASSKVNVRFVVMLAAGLTALFAAVAVLGYFALTKSGDEYAAMGDRLMKAGDYQKAADAYAKAVNHDRTRVAWLEKWRGALTQTIPETEIEYSKQFEMLTAVMETLATLQDDEAPPQREFLDSMMERFDLIQPGADAWQHLSDRGEEARQGLDPDSPESQMLRRYRGLASLQLMRIFPEQESHQRLALEDLTAAAKAADAMAKIPDSDWPENWPQSWKKDLDAEMGILQWHTQQWASERREGRQDRAEQSLETMRAKVEELKTKFPNEPRVLMSDVALQIELAVADKKTVEERRATLMSMAGIDKALLEAVAASWHDAPPQRFETLGQLLQASQPETWGTTIESIIDGMLAKRPDDPAMLRLKADRLRARGEYRAQIDTLQRIVDMPDMPVSLEGLVLKRMRTEAVYGQIEAWLAIRSAAAEEKDRVDALAQAKARRDALVDRLGGGGDSKISLLIDSKIASAEGKVGESVAKLTRLDELTTDGEPLKDEVLELLARGLERQGQMGAARSQWERLYTIRPFNFSAMMEAARISIVLSEPQRAEELLNAALMKNPDLEPAQKMLQALSARAGKTTLEDPVMQALVQVDKLRSGGDPDYPGARAVLDEAIAAHPAEPKLHLAAVQIEAEADDIEGLRRVIDRGSRQFPDSAQFAEFRERLAALEKGDRVQAMVDLIRATDQSESQKNMRIYQIYSSTGRTEEAAAALAAAIAADPDDPSVLDATFLQALTEKNFPKAQEIAARAARLNVDQADGLMYQARIELAQDDAPAAASTLEKASKKRPYDAIVWRLLGQAQLANGQVDRAVESLARAYELQPQDPQTAQIYCRALASLQRMAESLKVARETHERHPRSAEVAELWLELEEAAGDPQVALRKRLERYDEAPDDRKNMFAMLRLLMFNKRWDEARIVIDKAKTLFENDLDLALLEARWHGMQGGNGVDLGRQVIVDHIGRQEAGKETELPYLVLAQFLLENNQPEQGLAALDQAAKRQAPGKMNVERLRGDYLFDAQRYEEALASYKQIVDANADAGVDRKFLLLRCAETFIRLKRWDEADRMLVQATIPGEKDVRIPLLGAEVARGRGDMRKVKELLNQAVALSQTDPRPFIKRAELMFGDPQEYQNVLADLDQALKLDPTIPEARGLRAALYVRQNQPEKAVADLQEGIAANPASSELRGALVGQLLVMNRRPEAYAAVEAAVLERPSDLNWRERAGDVYMSEPDRVKRREVAGRAAVHFREAFTFAPNVQIAYKLASALLESNPPRSQEVVELVDGLGTDAQGNARLLAAKAQALAQLGQRDRAKVVGAEALQVVANANELQSWFNHVIGMFPAGTREELFAQVDFMKALTPPAALADMYAVELCRLQIPRTDLYAELLKTLEEIKVRRKAADDAPVLGDALRLIGTIQYSWRDYPKASEAFLEGAATLPNDIEFNNNAAFTLAKHMNDPKRALPFAQKAAELEPGNSTALDTLGWVHLQLEQHGQAQAILEKAVAAAVKPQEKAPAHLHRAQVRLAVAQSATDARDIDGAIDAARKDLTEVRDLLERYPGLEPEYKADLGALEAALAALIEKRK